MTGRDARLDAAYRQARYVVHAQAADLLLRIGESHTALSDLLDRHGADGAALLTAHNPRSQLSDEATNATADAALRAALTTYPTLPGRAEDPRGEWPPEDSVLVIGISLDAARALARRFGQNALVWVDRNGNVELIWVS